MTIAGHRTSVALEPEFWDGLEAMAAQRGVSLIAMVRTIDAKRKSPNLSSALRIAVLEWYRVGALPE